MTTKQKNKILDRAKTWWRDELVPAHLRNTLKLESLKEFTINPFTWSYLAYYLEGNNKPESLAKVLIYPRVLGTSINTTFGSRVQDFMAKVFEDTMGSMIPGMDLEFVDKIDGRKKYCQIKAGPNVINRDGVTTIKNHFTSAKNLARTNSLKVEVTDFAFCLLYGEPHEKNAFIKEVESDYPVFIGKEFWYRFTGDPDFYKDLIESIGEVATEVNMKAKVNKVVKDLAKEIKEKFSDIT